MYGQWVQLYELGPDNVEIIYRRFTRFGAVITFPTILYVLVCTFPSLSWYDKEWGFAERLVDLALDRSVPFQGNGIAFEQPWNFRSKAAASSYACECTGIFTANRVRRY